MRFIFTKSKMRWIPICYSGIAFLNPTPSTAGIKNSGLHSTHFLTTTDAALHGLQQQVKGKIIDEQGNPISGATIREKNSTQTTKSNADGTFSIQVASTNSILQVSSLGYSTREIPANQAATITLSTEQDEIEEVVVVGFGTQKKVNVTGAISHLDKEAFENRPVANIGQALQGLVPNLNISFGDGSPNSTPGFNLRGGTSMAYNANTKEFEAVNGDPLVIIDGVENTTTALNQLNPNDIKDMSFIKDASAAAIYGTKAAYGVILVRTKTGEFNQKGRISYNFDSSFDTPAALPDVLNSYEIQRASMDRTLWTNGSVSSSEENKLKMIQQYLDNPIPENAWYEESGKIIWVGNINPFETAVKKWTPMQKHTLNFSGGGENVNYYLSTGLQNQSGMYKINTDEFKRYNAIINVNAKITNWFNLFGKVSFDQTHYQAPYLVGGKGNLWQAMMNEPNRNINMPLLTGPDDPIANAYTDNILSWISYGARNRSVDRRISLLASPEFILIPNKLKLKSDLAYQPQSYSLNRFSPKMEQVLESWSGLSTNQTEAQENRAYLNNSDRNNYMVNVYADYSDTWNDNHNFSAILGFNQERTTYEQITNTYRRLINPNIQNPNATEDPSLNESTRYAETIAGRAVFARIGYNYAEKYFVESNLRYDGSAKFTKDERFVAFPSFSAGWRISKESFMEGISDWVNELKLRGSWGKLGNQPGLAYPYQATLGSGRAAFLLNGQQIVYINPPGLVAPQLTFEKARTWNIGLDGSFLQNKLGIAFEYYNRKTTDILTNGDAAFPNTLGAQPPYVNSGTLETRGMELSLTWKETLDNGLRYRLGVNLSDYLSKVVHFAGNSGLNIQNASGADIMYNGKTIGEIWGYKSGGILQESDFNGKNPDNGNWIYSGAYQGTLYPGYLRYQDIGGPEGIPDGKIDNGLNKIGNTGDRVVIGNSTPRYRFGITGNVQYRNFDLDVLVQGVMKRDVWTGNSAYWGGGAGSKWMLDNSWTPERTHAAFPMYGAIPSVNDQYLINGSYLRLKQAVLGYTLPNTLTEKIKIDRLRFTVSGFNLFEISDIPNVFDVDQISSAYPQKRTIAFGAQITF